MSTTFTHKGHAVEIVNDRSRPALIYIVTIDGEYVGDINNTMNVAIDQAKAFINRKYDPEPVPSWLRAPRAGTHVGYNCKPDCHCANCRPDLFVGSDLEEGK
jgi:hypothetical protein